MLIPRYSLRWLLLLTTLAGIFFLLLRAGAQGQVWAQATVIGSAFFLMSFVVFAVFFALLWTYSLVFHSRRSPKPTANATAQEAPAAPAEGDS